MARQNYRNPDCSVFVGNLDQRMTEELLWELFLQAGPVKSVYIPCDKDTGKAKAFGFVEFTSSSSANYAWELLDGIKVFDRSLSVRPQQKDTETANWIPISRTPACEFYKDFYKKYNDLKWRPQSEPRRSRWEEESYQNRNMSFNPPLNHSLSSPAHMSNMQQWQQTWLANSPMRFTYGGSPVPNPRFYQTSPAYSYQHR